MSNPFQIDVNSENGKVTFRRVILAKQMFLHGLDHSYKTGALNKMIAVHNFHNSIEIILKAIFLHFEIRPERELNIDFESMLNEVDRYQFFRDNGLKLPYRQEMRNLGNIRNLVQHHATEPDTANVEEYRVFTRRFLEKVYLQYFNLPFDGVSALSMVSDDDLRQLLSLASQHYQSKDYRECLAFTKAAFDWAADSLLKFLPEIREEASWWRATYNQNSDIESILVQINKTQEKLSDIQQRIRQGELLSAMLASGVTLVQWRTFHNISPDIGYMMSGNIILHWTHEPHVTDAEWAQEFAVNTIVNWQLAGLSPEVPPRLKDRAKHLIETGNFADLG